jgi:hypothetical protein
VGLAVPDRTTLDIDEYGRSPRDSEPPARVALIGCSSRPGITLASGPRVRGIPRADHGGWKEESRRFHDQYR